MPYSGVITSFLGEGAAASRPATPNIAPGAITFWYSTDTNAMSVYADGAWIENILANSSDATITALAAYNTNGLMTQTAADTFTGRTLTAGNAGTTITNPAGTAGNPVITSGVWTLAGTGQTATGVYDFATDGAKANIDFIGLAAFNELLVIARGLTDGTTGVRELLASVDNGSTFYNSSGNYKQIAEDGQESNVTAFAFHATASTSARSFVAHILNMKGAAKFCQVQNINQSQNLFDASASDINAVRINNSGGGNITAGTVRVFAR